MVKDMNFKMINPLHIMVWTVIMSATYYLTTMIWIL